MLSADRVGYFKGCHLLAREIFFVPGFRPFESFIATLFVTTFSKNASRCTPPLWQNLASLRNINARIVGIRRVKSAFDYLLGTTLN